MVDKVETPQVLDELTRRNAAPLSDESRPRRRRVFWRILLNILLFGPLLAALAVLAYWQWNQAQELNRLAAENSRLQETLQTSDTRIAELEASLDVSASTTSINESVILSLQEDFRNRLDQVNGLLVELQNQVPRSLDQQRQRWQLEEAEHLLRIAGRHLQLTADVPTAVSLLETAGQLLASSGDSRAAPARQALSEELAQLRAIAEFDPDQLYQRINRLRETLTREGATRPPQDIYLDQLAARSESERGSEPKHSLLDAGLQYLGSIFVWRVWEGEPELTPAPDQLYYARQNIDLLLQQAQLALLGRHRAIFLDSLQRAHDMLEHNSAALGEPASAMLTELQSLMREETLPVLPDISQSLELLEQARLRPIAGSADTLQ